SADARITRQGKALSIRTQRVTCGLPLLDFDPVRPQQSQSDRQTRNRIGLVVAHQGDQLDRLAGPVDAAIGVEEGVDGTRLRAAADAAVAQIESSAANLEKVEVAVGTVGR